MPAQKYKVTLSEAERKSLLALIQHGQGPAKKLLHARILLQADQGPSGPASNDQQISTVLHTSRATIERVRQALVEEGLERALTRRKPARSKAKKIDGQVEAHLIALACSTPPSGRVCWTMQLLADKLVELELVDTVSDETVRQTLKKRT